MPKAFKLSKKKIVVLGGGPGVFTVLSGLRRYFDNLTAIVTMSDDGGSTGVLREDFGVLPPGDIRRALIALAHTENKTLAELFNYRFKEGNGLRGHSFGNLMLTALERLTGSFEKAVGEAAKILVVQGQVLPVTLTPTRLFAELQNGALVRGENNIDVPKHDGNLRIQRVWLEPKAKLNPAARRAILAADLVLIGPGDLYTSLLPNVLVGGTREALRATKAKVIYLVNVTNKFGETNGFRASDFLKVMETHLGKGVIDYVVVSNRKPSPARLRPYLAEGSSWVKLDVHDFGGKPVLLVADLIRSRGFVRHDPNKVAKLILRLA